MSFLTDTDVNKRAFNLFPLHTADAAIDNAVALHATQALMQYFAAYTADVPGVQDIGGTFEATSAGTAVTLEDADVRAVFTGTGTVLGTNQADYSATSWCWEFEVLGDVSDFSNFAVGAYMPNAAPPYDANAFVGGDTGPFSSWYVNVAAIPVNGGTLISFVFSAAGQPSLAEGDVVGMVFDSGASQVRFYLNGTFLASFGTSDAVITPMASAI